jgi:aspartate-semialdehyde dehydrogenase
VKAGAFAIDNSAAFRMHAEFALIVPEVNGDLLPRCTPGTRPGAVATIIANPNCSTIQLVVALNPLAKRYGLKAVRVATYQSVSGAGRGGIEELFNQSRLSLEGEEVEAGPTFPAPIAYNCIPQIGSFGEDGFSSEETKIMRETSKIMRLPNLPVSAFAVRVPTMNGHAEAVWVTLEQEHVSQSEIENTLAGAPGLELMSSNTYPTQITASGRDPVYVGRVHRDMHDASTWLMWVVSDNLRKGAALNGIQIAESIFGKR